MRKIAHQVARIQNTHITRSTTMRMVLRWDTFGNYIWCCIPLVLSHFSGTGTTASPPMEFIFLFHTGILFAKCGQLNAKLSPKEACLTCTLEQTLQVPEFKYRSSGDFPEIFQRLQELNIEPRNVHTLRGM